MEQLKKYLAHCRGEFKLNVYLSDVHLHTFAVTNSAAKHMPTLQYLYNKSFRSSSILTILLRDPTTPQIRHSAAVSSPWRDMAALRGKAMKAVASLIRSWPWHDNNACADRIAILF